MNRFFETARLLKVVVGFALVVWALESPAPAGAVAPALRGWCVLFERDQHLPHRLSGCQLQLRQWRLQHQREL